MASPHSYSICSLHIAFSTFRTVFDKALLSHSAQSRSQLQRQNRSLPRLLRATIAQKCRLSQPTHEIQALSVQV